MPGEPLGSAARPGLKQIGLRGHVAWGSAPPPARPSGPLFPLPGPTAFPQGHPSLQSTQGSSPQLVWQLRAERLAEELPWCKAVPKLVLDGAFGAGISCLLPDPTRGCCPSRPPGCSRLPGFAMCLSRHPSSLFVQELGTLLPAALGMLGWHNHHPCTIRDHAAKQGGCAGLCPFSALWSLSFDLGRGHHGARSPGNGKALRVEGKVVLGGFPLFQAQLFHLESAFPCFLLGWRARRSCLAPQGFTPVRRK